MPKFCVLQYFGAVMWYISIETDFSFSVGQALNLLHAHLKLLADASQVGLPSCIAVPSIVHIYATLLYPNKRYNHISDTERNQKWFLLTLKTK